MQHTTNAGPWQDHENAALVTLYFAMLDRAIAGEKYNKAAMIREAQLPSYTHHDDSRGKLVARSRGSIEAKLMNASAAHTDLDENALTMHAFGYRALFNYQKSLKIAMRDELNGRAAELQRSA